MWDLLDRLGWRARERAEPVAAGAVASAGAALVVLGAAALGADNLGGGSGDDLNRIPGVVLSLLVIGAGYGIVATGPERPRAAAGVAASVVGVPLLFFFLTAEADFPPLSVDATLIGSTLVWAGSYAFAGRARGRPLYLAAALFGLWLFVLEQLESVFSAPFFFPETVSGSFGGEVTVGADPRFGGDLGGDGFAESFGPAVADVPDATTVGLVCLLFGIAYLVVMVLLDRRDYRGAATPFVPAGLTALFAGVVALAPDLEAVPTGLLVTGIGVGLAALGAASVRRLTTWAGALAVAVGIITVVGDLTDDDITGFSVALMLVGAGVVALAEWSTPAQRPVPAGPVAMSGSEPPPYASGGSVQPEEPPPGPAGDERG